MGKFQEASKDLVEQREYVENYRSLLVYCMVQNRPHGHYIYVEDETSTIEKFVLPNLLGCRSLIQKLN